MKLLHWCTVTPKGPSGLAAIRFAKLVRVSCIRVFPKGVKPFDQCPDIVSETEPESFFLDVYFNAQPVQPSQDSKEKQRATNALVPTSIAYAGGNGQVDFTVDFGTEYGTRLMILKGQFEALSLAIYGQIISDSVQPDITSSSLQTMPSVESQTLSASVNPASSSEPTFLARNLLSLLDDAPPLSLASKLMFCLKPENDDWDDPDFPYLFVDFDRDIFQTNSKMDREGDEDEDVNGEGDVTFDFEATLDAMSRPVSDTVSEDTLTKFAQAVAGSIGPKTNTQAFYIAKLLKLSASQRPSLALALCQAIDTVDVFDAESLDEDTLLHLLDAAANADIARYLNNNSFLSTLTEFQTPSFNALHPKTAKEAAERLATRIQAWDIFEDALSNTQADFAAASAMLRDIGSGEQSLGIWLASMTGHDDLVTKLAENPLYPNSGGAYPKLFVRKGLNNSIGGMGLGGSLSHDEFIAFVRAFIGVASVLAVWAWSDSLGNDVCRERTLGVLRLWQGTDYREIVNYLLLLRQFTLRLKWITTNDIPRKSGIFGEQILADILHEPEAALNNDLVQTILSLKQPLSHISESDRLSMRKIALVVEDGLPAAIEELTQPSAHPLSHRRLRTLRVSVALVERELAEDPQKGDWNILQTLWDEHSTALIPRLADLLTETAQDLNGHFLITSPFPAHQQLSSTNSLPQVLSQLFRLAEDILTLLLHLLLTPGSSSSSLPLGSGSGPFAFSLASYTLRSLVLAVADIFACTDAADTIYAQGTAACISAQSSRQTCLEFVRRASSFGSGGITIEPTGGKSGAEIVMNMLLKHSIASSGRDPAYHLLQMFALIDHILPESNSSMAMGSELSEDESKRQKEHWIVDVLPNVLDEIQEFFRQLDVENKVHLLRRLMRLDSKGLVGMAEWLLTEEIKLFERCAETLLKLVDQRETNIQVLVLLYQIGLHIRLVGHMLQTGSDMLDWSIGTLRSVQEAFGSLVKCLMDLLAARISSPHLDTVVETLLFHCESDQFNNDKFRFTLVLFSLRTFQQPALDAEILFNSALWTRALAVLKALSAESVDADALRLEIGGALAALATYEAMTPDSSAAILSFLEWLISQSPEKRLTVLAGIKIDTLTTLYDTLSTTLPKEHLDALDKLRTTLSVDEDETFVPVNLEIPDTLRLSLQELQDILIRSSSTQVPPSTPTRNNTPDVLGLVISPPAALLRSPAATGLSKTYSNNDFRELRQAAVARQNTSRLPSMHVDVGISGQST